MARSQPLLPLRHNCDNKTLSSGHSQVRSFGKERSMTKTFRVVAILVTCSLFVFCLLAVVPQAAAQNGTADPNAVYGHCWEGVHGLASAFHSKANHIFFVGLGATMANVAGIVVLECREFDGGGFSHIVDCPPGTPYS